MLQYKEKFFKIQDESFILIVFYYLTITEGMPDGRVSDRKKNGGINLF